LLQFFLNDHSRTGQAASVVVAVSLIDMLHTRLLEVPSPARVGTSNRRSNVDVKKTAFCSQAWAEEDACKEVLLSSEEADDATKEPSTECDGPRYSPQAEAAVEDAESELDGTARHRAACCEMLMRERVLRLENESLSSAANEAAQKLLVGSGDVDQNVQEEDGSHRQEVDEIDRWMKDSKTWTSEQCVAAQEQSAERCQEVEAENAWLRKTMYTAAAIVARIAEQSLEMADGLQSISYGAPDVTLE